MNSLKRPESVNEQKAMIVAAGLRLPEQQERVARAILARPDLVAFGTISSVASACVVSPSTVVRVANVLGFETFKELRLFFQQHMRSLSESGRAISFQSFASTERPFLCEPMQPVSDSSVPTR